MAISDKLQELLDVKQDIKVAIENKGVDLTGVEFDGYAEKIDEIQTGGGITDLTGYTWVANSYISSGFNDMETEFILNFNSNSLSYTSILIMATIIGFPSEDQLFYGSTKVYDNNGGGWQNSNYKTVTFTGGTDVTNTDLITWLEANGTLTPQTTAVVELTQAQYDALSVYDNNTYYLIVEV